MVTTPAGRGRPAAETDPHAAWEHLTTSPDYDPGAPPVGTLAEIAEHLDRIARACRYGVDTGEADQTDVLAALLVIRRLRERSAEVERDLIEAARKKTVTWARLAPALGVADRSAAERRYRRLVPPTYDRPGTHTQEGRVEAGRAERAEQRAQHAWVAAHAADVAVVAARVVALPDLDAVAFDGEQRRVANARRMLGGHRTGSRWEPPSSPTWPGALRAAVAAGDAHAMFHELHLARHDLAEAYPRVVEAVRELYAGASDARWAAVKDRFGPEDSDDEDGDLAEGGAAGQD
ncbi:hypothetical protein F0L68_41195 [Solihabitans fulvus]|uniref:Uncharacterized protein n=1 Tax=Solihabitans fulvus TaxID=1892852 RepID=A0A5B2W3G5_9PSEU|nr:hypothetical protein [Solihabitans fulvus]KAA2245885.1 hypothetical protein F0L68_41195 [Solihabitans fulvus]